MKFEKKWDLVFWFLLKLKSEIKFDFLFACLYSVCIKILSSKYNLGDIVKSLLLSNTLKYGICNDCPFKLEFLMIGNKKPDCLFTVGSGW